MNPKFRKEMRKEANNHPMRAVWLKLFLTASGSLQAQTIVYSHKNQEKNEMKPTNLADGILLSERVKRHKTS